MPFLGGLGQIKIGRGFFASGKVPDAPTNISSLAGNQQLSISFDAPAFNGGLDITNYEYSISTDGGSNYGSWTAFSPPDTVSPVVVSGLTNGTNYVVRLRAVNALGGGPSASTPVIINDLSTTPFTVPSAPTISSSTAANQQLTISFSAPASNGRDITNYQYSTDSGSTWKNRTDGQTTSTSMVITQLSASSTSLSNGTNYTIRIRAVNEAGSGSSSSGYNDAATLTTQPYGVPLSAVATLTDGCNLASWAFSANANGRPITAYTYQISTNGGASWGVETPGSSFSLDTSKSSSATIVRVKAQNAAGYGSYGSASSANATRSAGTGVTQYSGTCGNRESRTATPWTRTGCTAVEPTNYTYTSYVSSPDCNSTCFDASSPSVISSRYSGSCLSRVRYDTTRVTYTAKAGTNCSSYNVDTEGGAIADPTCGSCGGSCWTENTGSPSIITVGSQQFIWYYVGEVGNYRYVLTSGPNSCDGANAYFEYGRIYNCNSSYCFVKEGCSYQGCC